MNSDCHTFAGSDCKVAGTELFTVVCLDNFLREFDVEGEPVGSTQQFETGDVDGGGPSAKCCKEGVESVAEAVNGACSRKEEPSDIVVVE